MSVDERVCYKAAQNGHFACVAMDARKWLFRDGLVLPQSVTMAALSEKLHFVSGFPVYCNDPATDKELGVVREFVKSVVVHNRALRANEFLIVSLDPKPLEQVF